ncbi:Cytochrome P450 [Glarea lozoyensis ATCC 20868]|uniref:Cytochrome P450 n=1 Tax=Glarea lozoyensis (strain ATCC 20868 / MF5171) TaxID=1116229 RepID=S3CXS2_GLAL2|nr:Cytochrome P450 [Glarea lozoyensis ATCC 20868]EPE30390.1 Cytochrome P450 [Glarea lozoyensis ATCC 20868]
MVILDISSFTWTQWAWVFATVLASYLASSCIYLLYFHPASKFPGPKLAAVSYVTYCSHWIRGRYPWFLEEMLHEYGDAVRIGPNEVAFFTPQAAEDIYGAAIKGQELFLKTDLMNFGTGDLGYIWENDPVKRKAAAKKILPALSTKAIRNMEPTIHFYLDLFISKMKDHGTNPEGCLMSDWLLWLATDMAADLTYNREFHHMRDGKGSDFLETLRGTSFVGILMQLSKKIPMIKLITPFFIPLKVLRNVPASFRANSAEVKSRIEKRGNTAHPDFMDFMIAPDGPSPMTKKELTHIEQVALQMFIAGFDPVQITFYAFIFLLLKNPQVCTTLTKEIRDSFKSYEEITPQALLSLKYLAAFISETLRVYLPASTGSPRVSPGAIVDGVYVAKGIVCQLSTFTAQRHERWFRDPLEFHPERWLPQEHPLYDEKYADDNLKAAFPFGLGPRQCPGKEIAWVQCRLFLGKLLWSFDLEGVSGHEKYFDKDFKAYLMWERPELWVRFLPARD